MRSLLTALILCVVSKASPAEAGEIPILHRLHADVSEIEAARQDLIDQFEMDHFEGFEFITVHSDPYARCYFSTKRTRLHPAYICRRLVVRGGDLLVSYFGGTVAGSVPDRERYETFAQKQVSTWQASLPLMISTFGLPGNVVYE